MDEKKNKIWFAAKKYGVGWGLPAAWRGWVVFVSISVCFSSILTFAEEGVDLIHLTAECIKAAKEHKAIRKDFPYKVLHTVRYQGFSGDSNNFKLTHHVVMTIKYAGTSKEGYYWFKKHPQKRYKITAKSDLEGNFELVEKIGNGSHAYTFRGVMNDGIIKGLWEKGDGKKAYAFYMEVIE